MAAHGDRYVQPETALVAARAAAKAVRARNDVELHDHAMRLISALETAGSAACV